MIGPASEATRAKMREAQRIGTYETPWGFHATIKEALAYVDAPLTAKTLRKMCRDSQRVITERAYNGSPFLKTLGPWVIGKSYADVGFGFAPIRRTKIVVTVDGYLTKHQQAVLRELLTVRGNQFAETMALNN